jgi:hypothetical protein
MKDIHILKRVTWLLAICFVSTLAFTACKTKCCQAPGEQSGKSEDPAKATPAAQPEHPEHPK